jgi:tetratricopeptide (TPR) repeat protein
LQRYDKALYDYDQAITLNPDYVPAYYSRGVVYTDLQRYDEALRDYDQAITLNPDYVDAYLNLGIILSRDLGKLHEALPYLEKAAQLGDAQGVQYAAQVKQMLGMEPTSQIDLVQQALEAFQQAESVIEMQQAVAQFPLLARVDFLGIIEQVIAQQVPPEHRPALEQRLAWLRQIANEQK